MKHRTELQMVARTDQHAAIVELESLDAAAILRGGPVTVRTAAAAGTKPTEQRGTVVLRGYWSDYDGLTQEKREPGVGADFTVGQFVAIEVALHDAASEEVAAARVAQHHLLSHAQAYCVLHALFGREGVDVWTAVGCRPSHLRHWTDSASDERLVGVTGWVFWWEKHQSAISATSRGVSHHPAVPSLEAAVTIASGYMRCQCGTVTQVECTRFAKRQQMMVIDWMPYPLRSSYESPQHQGKFPSNGSIRLLCTSQCGKPLLENEEGWARLHENTP